MRAARVPYISVMSDPTTGGVFASYAVLGDVNLAEPNALIGFAGARVSAGTIAQELPAGFQRSEFLFEHGFIDRVVHRRALRGEIASLLRFMRAPELPSPWTRAAAFSPLGAFLSSVVGRRERRGYGGSRHAATGGNGGRTAANGGRDGERRWLTGCSAAGGPAGRRRGPKDDRREAPAADPEGRHVAPRPARPQPRPPADPRPAAEMADEVIELHGDRGFGDDPAMAAGFARIDGRRIAFVGQQKGADTDENIRRNFGMPHPEGYRKSMRIMELAERFGLPIVTFVDVPGAHPGPESEERGIAEAIARSIGLMSRLRTPIVAIITGEGGSGGALAIAVGDVVIALENAVYSVISPEGCASILWRTADEAPTAALAMRMSAQDQLELGVIDRVVPEPGEGAHAEPARDRSAPAERDHRRARSARRCSRRTSSSRRATGATARSARTLRSQRPRWRHRPAGGSPIAFATCSTRRAGRWACPCRARRGATSRRQTRRSDRCPTQAASANAPRTGARGRRGVAARRTTPASRA